MAKTADTDPGGMLYNMHMNYHSFKGNNVVLCSYTMITIDLRQQGFL